MWGGRAECRNNDGQRHQDPWASVRLRVSANCAECVVVADRCRKTGASVDGRLGVGGEALACAANIDIFVVGTHAAIADDVLSIYEQSVVCKCDHALA